MSRYPVARPSWAGWSDQRTQRELLRAIKRQEAEERNARTPHERRRAHREGRCGCWKEAS